jgi:hypothetical protein
MISIPYSPFPIPPSNKLDPKQSSLFRPVVELKLKSKDGKEISYSALIDSGADYCLFHGIIGEQIGLNVKKGKPLNFYGTGGRTQTAYFHEIMFSIEGTEITTMVGFSYGLESLNVGLLGQTGFFNKFKIEFDLQKRIITLDN